WRARARRAKRSCETPPARVSPRAIAGPGWPWACTSVTIATRVGGGRIAGLSEQFPFVSRSVADVQDAYHTSLLGAVVDAVIACRKASHVLPEFRTAAPRARIPGKK